MPVLRIHDREHTLQSGKTRLGGGNEVDVRVTDDEGAGTLAVIDLAEGHTVIRRMAETPVKVNGVSLGAEPTPLMHGDKIEIAGRELLYGEDAKAGTTRYVTHSDVKSILEKRAGAPRATIGSGGRLVSLVDGKEYKVPDRGITIGRDASSDVVVAQNEVSRRHAEIVPSERGYLIHDYSTNGVYVNNVRVLQSQVLSRSDVVRIGTEEFRFYADVLISGTMKAATMPTPAVDAAPIPEAPKAAPPTPAPLQPPAPQPAPAQPAAVQPPAAAAKAASPQAAAPAPSVPAPKPQSTAASAEITHRVAAIPDETPPATAPAPPRPDPRPLLAVLEIINEGVSRGKRYDVRVPLVHVGRGPHNDVVIDDDSVSDTHAKIQRREDGWYLIDLGSTNGTYVGGSRLTSERRLDGAPDVRFGGVKLTFRPADTPAPAAKSTRAIATMPVDRSKLPKREPRPSVAARPAEPPAERSGTSAWVWLLILIVAAVAFYLLKS